MNYKFWLYNFQSKLKKQIQNNRYGISAFWYLKNPTSISVFYMHWKMDIPLCCYMHRTRESDTLTCYKVVVSKDWDQGDQGGLLREFIR